MKMNKKVVAIAAAGLLTVATAGTAYAYWTTTGAGSGTATNAGSNGTLVLHANFAAGLSPNNAETVTYTADNGGSSDLFLTSITPTVTTSIPGCSPAWFTITDQSVTPRTVAHGASGVPVGSATLSFVDSGTNQDSCKNAVITVTLASI